MTSEPRVLPLRLSRQRSALPKSIDAYFPHFQPMVYLPTGAIAGYELLARTHDRQGRVQSAGPLFGDESQPTDFKIAVDRHLRLLGFERFAAQPDNGFISINISPDWISRLGSDISSPTLRLIEQTGIDPARVIIEITEASGNLDRIQQVVRQYHAAGLRVAIDDFGAGYSQLDRVIALNPDIIKLDMRLFKLAAKGGISADVLLGMTAIAERSGCEVVCEGVETEDEFYFGVECGAQYMQGYLFSPAISEMLQPQAFRSRVRVLTEHYLQRKCQRMSATADHSAVLKKLIFELQDVLNVQNGNNPGLADGTIAAMRRAGIMRYFICDLAGNQISPNYEIGERGIVGNEQYRGYNWSWRPYFPTLLSLRDRAGFNLVASTVYRDVNTSQLCKTFGLFLQDQHILLVDAAVRDEVLYADG
jgi:EAL domain-containing protein (putative c-di-GMP-specific phosphodiesterase class I)